METKGIVYETKGCMDVEVERELITGWILDFYDETKVKKEDLKDLSEEVINVSDKADVIVDSITK